MIRSHVPKDAPSCAPRASGRVRAWTALLVTALAAPACGTQVEADDAEVDAVVAAASLPTAGDSGDGFSRAAQEGSFSVAEGGRQPSDASAHYTILYSERDAELRARADGHVRSIHAEIGDRVASGQRLAALEDEEAAAGVASAEAALEYARHQEERTRTLAEGELTTRVELEEATFQLRAAEAELQDATARLERTRIRAPFSGVVTRRFVRLGTYVEEGDPLYRVTALRPLRALVRVPEVAASGIERGHPMVLEALDGTRVAARVARVAPAVDPASGTVDVLLDIPDPGSLRPGSSVRVLSASQDGSTPEGEGP